MPDLIRGSEPPNRTADHDDLAESTLLSQGRQILHIVIPTIFGIFVLAVLYNVWQVGTTGMFDEIFKEQPAALIGMPFSAIAALCLVLLLRSTSGPIEFEAIGFKFRGAAGPIIMWVITFLAFVLSLKLLWVQ